MLRCFLVILCALCAQSRLSKDVRPELYRLKLELISRLNTSTDSYRGSVSVSLNVASAIKSFTLHALGLNIFNTSLTYEVSFGTSVSTLVVPHNFTVGEESVVIASDMPTGRYRLDMTFEGKFGTDLEGFYKSSYKTQQTRRWIASTHFESQGARKVFPCFDEPSMRAKLILELILPPGLHAVSNMPVSNTTTLKNGWSSIQFAESPPMPTYLMAWYVGDATFDVLYSTALNGVTYSVHGRTELKEQGEYAFNVTPTVIKELESFTGVLYNSSSMTTLAQVAIPDFSAGAMENWGLVTYRESYLMYNRNASSVLDKQHILLVIAHELAHQWFGNAVTLDWWSSPWLNEGFARYLQYVVPNKMEPSWMLNNLFLTDVFQLSMAADLGGHPLTNPIVTSKDEIEDMFDVLTYGKGASLLRMFSSILGEEAFKAWLNKYLTSVTQTGGVAKPEDLFSALSNTSLADKFKPWTEVSGHPVVNVSSVRHNDSVTLRLSQMKENLTGSRLPTGLHVPIHVFASSNNTLLSFVSLANETSSNYNYTVQSHSSPDRVDFWLENETVELHLTPPPEWYLINFNTGYYRVLYDEENWKSLRKAISKDEVPPLTRAQLVSDAVNLLKTGYLQPTVGFEFVRFLSDETDLLVWKAGLMAIKDVRDHLLGWTDARDQLDDFVRTLMNKVQLDKFNFTVSEDRHYESVLLMYLAKQLRTYHSSLSETLQRLPELYPSQVEMFDRVTDGALLCQLSVDGNEWENLFLMYLTSETPTEKARYLNSLSCTENSTLQFRLLEYTLQPDVISLQDIKSVFTRICDSKNGERSAMKFLREHGPQFVKRVTSKRSVHKMLEAISNKLYTNGMIEEMQNLLWETPELDLTNQEKSNLISNAKKATGIRQLVAKRVCDGLELVCVPPLDVTSETDAATGLTRFLTAFLVIIAVTVSSV